MESTAALFCCGCLPSRQNVEYFPCQTWSIRTERVSVMKEDVPPLVSSRAHSLFRTESAAKGSFLLPGAAVTCGVPGAAGDFSPLTTRTGPKNTTSSQVTRQGRGTQRPLHFWGHLLRHFLFRMYLSFKALNPTPCAPQEGGNKQLYDTSWHRARLYCALRSLPSAVPV